MSPTWFCFAFISARKHRIFKILVSTPDNTPLIMGGRLKNFEDPVLSGWDKQNDAGDVVAASPFN